MYILMINQYKNPNISLTRDVYKTTLYYGMDYKTKFVTSHRVVLQQTTFNHMTIDQHVIQTNHMFENGDRLWSERLVSPSLALSNL